MRYSLDETPLRGTRRRWAVAGAAALAAAALLAVVLTSNDGPPAPAGPANEPVPPAELDTGGWDLAAQVELATRPMLQLPEAATQPHELASPPGPPTIRLPKPAVTAGRVVPGGFPATPEGALAQLAALTSAGLAGGDPQTYASLYRQLSLPGAPPPESTSLFTGLQRLRSRAGIPPTGPVPGIRIAWTPAAGMIKGTTDANRYAVVCALGELTAEREGRFISGGIGDCQALRHVDGQWRISPGPAATTAPSAWPGTAEAVAAGYRAVT